MIRNDLELSDYKLNGNSFSLIEKYRQLISSIAKLSKGIYSDTSNSQWKWFYSHFLENQPVNCSNLLEVQDRVKLSMHWITYKGVYNQVVVFFLEYAKKYDPEGKLTFNKYVRWILGKRATRWVGKYFKEFKNKKVGYEVFTEDFYTRDVYPVEIEPFTIDIGWILHGSNSPVFQDLSVYQRYLMYLYFVEGYSIRKIAEVTYKSKNTINKDINCVLVTCRKRLSLNEEL